MRQLVGGVLGAALLVAALPLAAERVHAQPSGVPLLWYVVYWPAVEAAAQPPPQCQPTPNGVSCTGGLLRIPVTLEYCNPSAYESQAEAEADAQTRMPAGDWFVVQAVDAAHAHAIVEVDHFGSQPLSPALREYEIDQAAADWVRLCARITMPPPLPTPSTTASGPCPFSAAQLAALATDTSALGGLGQTDVSMALPTQAQQLGVCAAFIARWAHSDDVLTSDPAADDNREHNELLLAFPSAEDASNAFQTLIAQLQPDERTRILDTPSLGEEALAVQSYSSAELVTEPDGRIHEVPDDADFTFLFRRGPVLVVSDDKFSANSADMGLASMLAQAIDSRIVATLK